MDQSTPRLTATGAGLIAMASAATSGCALLAGAKRNRLKADALDKAWNRYYAAQSIVGVEEERAVHAVEAKSREATTALVAAREILQREYDEKLAAAQAEMASTRTDDCKKAWLLGYTHGQRELIEDSDYPHGVVIPWRSNVATGTPTT